MAKSGSYEAESYLKTMGKGGPRYLSSGREGRKEERRTIDASQTTCTARVAIKERVKVFPCWRKAAVREVFPQPKKGRKKEKGKSAFKSTSREQRRQGVKKGKRTVSPHKREIIWSLNETGEKRRAV